MTKTLCTAALVLLAACGGGSEDPPAPPANPNEPNDSTATATPLTIGTPVVARIAQASDVDFYAFTVPAGGATVRFQTFDSGGVACDPTNQAVDPFVEVHGAGGAFIAGDDDGGVLPWCEDLSVALPAGAAYVMVGGKPDRNGTTAFDYTLKVTIP